MRVDRGLVVFVFLASLIGCENITLGPEFPVCFHEDGLSEKSEGPELESEAEAALIPALDPVEDEPAFAVVSTQFTDGTSISLLDAEGEVLAENWLTSASTYPQQVEALSTDVALASEQRGDGSLTVIDRFGTDVVSRYDFATGNLYGQVRTDDDRGSQTSYSSNPHDMVFMSVFSAWASRFEPNTGPEVDESELGTDLIEIEPLTMQRTCRRIDLSSLNQSIQVASRSGASETKIAYARPNRLLRVGEFIAVGLDLLTRDFYNGAPGRLALVDPREEDGAIQSVGLDGLRNCGEIRRAPQTQSGITKIFVSCVGDEYRSNVDTAGIALVAIDESNGAMTLEASWHATEIEERPLAVELIVAISEGAVAAIEFSADFLEPHTLYLIDLASGQAHELASGMFGRGTFDAETGLLLMPDQDQGVRRWTQSEIGFVELDPVPIDKLGLPAMEVYQL